MNPKFHFFVYLLFCLLPVFSQEETKEGNGPVSRTLRDIKGPENHKHYYLENIQKPGKTARLPANHVILLINESKHHPDVLSRFNITECYLDTLVGDSLSFRIINEEIEVERRNMYSNITSNYYAGTFPASYRKVNLADLRYLSMRNPLRTNLTRAGTVLMSLSILTLIASPFAGIGSEGEQKAQKRGQVFVAGISGMAVSIPFFIFGKNKKYGLQSDFSASGKNYWTLKQKR